MPLIPKEEMEEIRREYWAKPTVEQLLQQILNELKELKKSLGGQNG